MSIIIWYLYQLRPATFLDFLALDFVDFFDDAAADVLRLVLLPAVLDLLVLVFLADGDFSLVEVCFLFLAELAFGFASRAFAADCCRDCLADGALAFVETCAFSLV